MAKYDLFSKKWCTNVQTAKRGGDVQLERGNEEEKLDIKPC
jgi:hypothetical protein